MPSIGATITALSTLVCDSFTLASETWTFASAEASPASARRLAVVAVANSSSVTNPLSRIFCARTSATMAASCVAKASATAALLAISAA